MAEEQRYEQSNAPTILNLCSKCYRGHRLKEQQNQEMESLLASTASVKSAPPPSFANSSLSSASSVESLTAVVAAANDLASSGPSRCGACRKRVGLKGFKCRCGTMYCGAHRYVEQHSCRFDFKALGKEAISKANPVIKAAKLDHKI